MLALIPLAQKRARPLLSNFRVGAVALGGSGAIYLGANAEIDLASLAHTIHAEQSAVVNALLSGETALERLAVSAAPCGHCRQFLNELASADRLQVVWPGRTPVRVADLLPAAFGPRDLGVAGGLPSPTPLPLEWTAPVADPLAEAAKAFASRSYVPYTREWAGLALEVRSPAGVRTVGGMALENAAFNPSLSPLQTALISLLLRGLAPEQVTAAALVHRDGARVAVAEVTAAFLARLAPAARLTTPTARPA
jgi:cytidine deaminase